MYHGLLFLLFLMVYSCTCAFAADSDAVGRVKTINGPVYIIRGAEQSAAKIDMKIVRNDILLTGKQGSMGIVFNDNSTLSLGPNTKFRLASYEFNALEKKAGFVGQIRRGTMVYLSGLIARMNADATRFETPVAVAGVRGTKLAIKVEGGDNE
ncbi:MAG: FecR domain-containing protein [Deltaproteobacteria bacterium]|nr:FecR domain-containing protein [Deltaproteobacteria bacterium]